MKQYEMLCVLPGTLAEAEVAPTVASIQEVMGKYAASEVVAQDLGKSRLAYPVKHIRYGYFHLFTFSLEPTSLQALERGVRLLGSNILRVIVQVRDPKKVQAAISLAVDPTALSRPPREDGPRRERTFNRPDVKKEVREEKIEKPEVAEAVVPALNLENIDEKLDEILQKDIDKV